MITFLPCPDFIQSAKCLDRQRLGKQRLEAWQISNILTLGHSGYGKKGWNHHPAVHMWRGYEQALNLYMNACIREWIHRGYRNNMKIAEINEIVIYPWWFGNNDFHSSHRSNLLRKNPEWYGQFNWTEKNDLPYIWPKRKLFV